MYANAIPLREKLDFQQYQKAVKAFVEYRYTDSRARRR